VVDEVVALSPSPTGPPARGSARVQGRPAAAPGRSPARSRRRLPLLRLPSPGPRAAGQSTASLKCGATASSRRSGGRGAGGPRSSIHARRPSRRHFSAGSSSLPLLPAAGAEQQDLPWVPRIVLLARSNKISRGSRESSFPWVRVSWAYEGESGATGISRLPGGDRCDGICADGLTDRAFAKNIQDSMRASSHRRQLPSPPGNLVATRRRQRHITSSHRVMRSRFRSRSPSTEYTTAYLKKNQTKTVLVVCTL
jgi:hypothetical protein